MNLNHARLRLAGSVQEARAERPERSACEIDGFRGGDALRPVNALYRSRRGGRISPVIPDIHADFLRPTAADPS